MPVPSKVIVSEVGMCDGLQMEARILSTDAKIEVGLALITAGVRRLEATAFLSPRSVPQLDDAADVIGRLKGRGAELSAQVPNVNGAWRAVAAGADRMAVSISASETHNLKNLRRTIGASLDALKPIARVAFDAHVPLSGTVSTAFGCPYEGEVNPDAVLRIVDGFVATGVDEISLGDTTGMATPPLIDMLVERLRLRHPDISFSMHLRNSRGLGLVNVMRGLQLGVDRFESSIGGLGACLFAPGASGNVCTEDLVHLLNELGIQTGIDLEQLTVIARTVQGLVGRELPGQVMKSGPRLRKAHSR